jgi:hypothetical protein
VFEKNFGASPPRPQYFPEKLFGFWKKFLRGPPNWRGPKFFISSPNQKPLGTALLARFTEYAYKRVLECREI